MNVTRDLETAPVNVRVVKLWVAITFPMIAAAASIATGWAVRAGEISSLREDVKRIEEKIDSVNNHVEKMDGRVGGLAERLSRVEGLLEATKPAGGPR